MSNQINKKIKVLCEFNQPEVIYIKEVIKSISSSMIHSEVDFIQLFETQYEFYIKDLMMEDSSFIEYENTKPLIYIIDNDNQRKYKIIGSTKEFMEYITIECSFILEYNQKYYESLCKIEYESFLKTHKSKFIYMKMNICQKLIVFELFNDICPITSTNFFNLCLNNEIKQGNQVFSYVNCEVFRVVRNGFLQSGDIKNFSSSTRQGKSSNAEFEDENFIVKHDHPGILGMVKNKCLPHSNQCQFYITFNSLSSFDGKFVAFGRVVKGFDVIKHISEVETYMQKPVVKIFIEKTGEYVGHD